MFDHGVKDRQEFAHASDQGDLGFFAGSAKTIVELSNHRIASAGHQGSHVQSGAHRGSTTPDPTLAFERAAVTVKRRHTRQRSDLFAIEPSKFRQFGEQGAAGDRTDTGDTLEQVLVGLPDRALPDALIQIMVGSFDLLFQPADVSRDPLSEGFRSAITPVGFSHDHRANLAAWSDEIFDLPAGLVRQSTDLWANHFGKVGQDIGVDAVGLGQLASGPGKVSDLTGVDDGQREVFTGQISGHRSFQIARGFQHDQSRLEPTQPLDQGHDSSLVVGERFSHARGTYTDIELCFGHVDTDKDRTIQSVINNCAPSVGVCPIVRG